MSTLQVDVHGVVGLDVDSSMVAAIFRNAGAVDEISVSINSPGGSVHAGTAIYNLLKRHPANVTVFVDGLAASIASIVMLAGDTVIMGTGARIMVHDPVVGLLGGAKDLRKYADLLDSLKASFIAMYVARTGQPAERITAWMDGETWFNAAEAIEFGFADRLATDRTAITNRFDLSVFSNLPVALRASVGSERRGWASEIAACADVGELQAAVEDLGAVESPSGLPFFAPQPECGPIETLDWPTHK